MRLKISRSHPYLRNLHANIRESGQLIEMEEINNYTQLPLAHVEHDKHSGFVAVATRWGG
jgi:hypothetical protein